ncbi:MAG: flagellar basal body rod protein FlgB, partial [Pseudohongiellaceae bacterium]
PAGYRSGAEIKYRQPLQPSLDGNTVESEVEMGEFSENAMRYMFSLRIVGGRLQKLSTAFRGE